MMQGEEREQLQAEKNRLERHRPGETSGGAPTLAGHRGHHLTQVEVPDAVLAHAVEQCKYCQQDLRSCPTELPERRQVIDLPAKRLWVTKKR